MLTICSRWDTLNLDPVTEWRMWRQLRGAFNINRFAMTDVQVALSGVDLDQYATMEDALASCTGTKVFLEPTGTHTMDDVPDITTNDVVFILGNTHDGNAHLVQPGDLSVALPCANPVDLYGVNAAAIALAIASC